jgi:hypothetical protein
MMTCVGSRCYLRQGARLDINLLHPADVGLIMAVRLAKMPRGRLGFDKCEVCGLIVSILIEQAQRITHDRISVAGLPQPND